MATYVIINDSNVFLYRDSVIKLYQKSFIEEPYCEYWTYSDVLKIWNSHLLKGLIIVCVLDQIVIGFVFGHQSKMSTDDIIEALVKHKNNTKLEFDLNKIIYVSELVVACDQFQEGIARALVDSLFSEAKKMNQTHYCMGSDIKNSINELMTRSELIEDGIWYGPLPD